MATGREDGPAPWTVEQLAYAMKGSKPIGDPASTGPVQGVLPLSILPQPDALMRPPGPDSETSDSTLPPRRGKLAAFLNSAMRAAGRSLSAMYQTMFGGTGEYF